mgnify:CR=1 FL=1
MRITITGKNIEVSEYLSDLVTKKVSKLDKYFPEDTEAHVTLAVERNRHIVEVTIPYAGGIIRGEVASVPVMPMATPMSASFTAGASFTPSPVMVTMCPRRL